MLLFTYTVDTLHFVPSDPPDGDWYTAIARCTVSDNSGRHESDFGYASDTFRNQQVIDRAISEALERAVARLIHRTDPDAAEKTTTGSAVHRTAELALVTAQRELAGSLEFVQRFHKRQMGVPYRHHPIRFLPNAARAAAWVDPGCRLIFCAIIELDARPRLAMTVRDITGTSLSRSFELSVLEILQPRPWLRHHLMHSRQRTVRSLHISDVVERATYWATIDSNQAANVYDELVSGTSEVEYSDADPDLHTSYEPIAEAQLQGEAGTLYFARVVHPKLQGKYITGDIERTVFWRPGPYDFHPHPLI